MSCTIIVLCVWEKKKDTTKIQIYYSQVCAHRNPGMGAIDGDICGFFPPKKSVFQQVPHVERSAVLREAAKQNKTSENKK